MLLALPLAQEYIVVLVLPLAREYIVVLALPLAREYIVVLALPLVREWVLKRRPQRESQRQALQILSVLSNRDMCLGGCSPSHRRQDMASFQPSLA